MIRSFALHDIPVNHIAAMERWYFRDHAPEIIRRYAPWLARFECYLPVPAPADVQAYGFYNWRMTEGWWRELPAGCDCDPFFTPAPVPARVAACFVPPQPTECFRDGDFLPLEKAPLRWLALLKYPAGVTESEGEEWFLHTHGPELARLPGVLRVVSWTVAKEVTHVPGRWRPDSEPAADRVKPRWDRVLELWFETFDDWRTSLAATKAECTQPPWRTEEAYPFVKPFEDFVSTFILERPNDDFLRDLRAYVP